MTLIGRKILLTNTDDSGNPTLDFPITSIECVEGGASQNNIETLQSQLSSLSELVGTLKGQLDNLSINLDGVADYIVESYQNGAEWYVLYKSGRLRQGMETYFTRAGYQKMWLKPFADTTYSVQIALLKGNDADLDNDKTETIVERGTTYIIGYKVDTALFSIVAEGKSA